MLIKRPIPARPDLHPVDKKIMKIDRRHVLRPLSPNPNDRKLHGRLVAMRSERGNAIQSVTTLARGGSRLLAPG
jgi:hypothetical protein